MKPPSTADTPYSGRRLEHPGDLARLLRIQGPGDRALLVQRDRGVDRVRTAPLA
jgi:hypothetical protein